MCRRWLAIFHTSSARFGRPHATMEEGISLAAQFVVNDLSRAISAGRMLLRTTSDDPIAPKHATPYANALVVTEQNSVML